MSIKSASAVVGKIQVASQKDVNEAIMKLFGVKEDKLSGVVSVAMEVENNKLDLLHVVTKGPDNMVIGLFKDSRAAMAYTAALTIELKKRNKFDVLCVTTFFMNGTDFKKSFGKSEADAFYHMTDESQGITKQVFADDEVSKLLDMARFAHLDDGINFTSFFGKDQKESLAVPISVMMAVSAIMSYLPIARSKGLISPEAVIGNATLGSGSFSIPTNPNIPGYDDLLLNVQKLDMSCAVASGMGNVSKTIH